MFARAEISDGYAVEERRRRLEEDVGGGVCVGQVWMTLAQSSSRNALEAPSLRWGIVMGAVE
jgi:hypothetical protein